MSDWRGWEEEMPLYPIDDAAFERLLAGTVPPQDAPAGFAPLAELIQAVQAPAGPAELADSSQLAAIVDAVRSNPPAALAPRRKPMLTKLLTAKAAALAAITVLGGTAAAAATGTLPAPAQSTAAGTLAHVGLSVPNPDSHASANATATVHGKAGDAHGQEGEAHGKAGAEEKVKADEKVKVDEKVNDDAAAKADTGDEANVPGEENPNAQFGLCTAFLAGSNGHATTQATPSTTSGKYESTAFSNLIAAHEGTAASTTAYCKMVVAAHKAATPAEPAKPEAPGRPADKPKPAGPPADKSDQATSAAAHGALGAAAKTPVP